MPGLIGKKIGMTSIELASLDASDCSVQVSIFKEEILN